MCVCIHVSVVYICACMCVSVCMICLCVYTCVFAVYVCVDACMYLCVICVCGVYMCMHVCGVHMCMHMCVSVCVVSGCVGGCMCVICVCVCVCIYWCGCNCLYEYMCVGGLCICVSCWHKNHYSWFILYGGKLNEYLKNGQPWICLDNWSRDETARNSLFLLAECVWPHRRQSVDGKVKSEFRGAEGWSHCEYVGSQERTRKQRKWESERSLWIVSGF